jgi:energy-converting hydrogenase Eha subunit F
LFKTSLIAAYKGFQVGEKRPLPRPLPHDVEKAPLSPYENGSAVLNGEGSSEARETGFARVFAK